MRDAILKLESIRDDQRDKYYHHLRGRVAMGDSERRGSAGLMGKRPFVKEVVGVNYAGRPVKKDLKGHKSYREAKNDLGTRGVFYWYTMRHGGCFLIQEQLSWKQVRLYYAIALDGRLMEINEKQAVEYVASTEMIHA